MIGIEPASLSTAPVGTKGGDQRVWRLRLVSDGKSTLGDNGGVHQAEWSSPSLNRAELSMDIEPPSLSTAPVGTEGGDQRVWRFVLVSDGTSTLGDNGGVQQAERSSQDRGGQRQIESGSVGKHEWSFGKRGLGMTQEGLGALPDLGIRAGRAVLRWNKASRLMRRKTSTDMVNLNVYKKFQGWKIQDTRIFKIR